MTAMSQQLQSPIGQSLPRREDYRFLTGAGNYTDDVVLPGQTYGVFLRSPYAHARIRSIDTSAAAKAPGVLKIFIGTDLADGALGEIGSVVHVAHGALLVRPPRAWRPTGRTGSP